ncbi:unnamed protein product [Blepharisma stoltei]|uniref:Uncharacterized protein n=1 Tax=Blepharisma stoltei TaxID=1481888 RepID=A0AAU9IE31_9CILI|nr:unnamed protein product [Blepharisma stoltei]
MSLITAAKATLLISQIENARDELEEGLRQIHRYCWVPSNCDLFLHQDILRSFKIPAVSKELSRFPIIVAEIKEHLSQTEQWVSYIAYQNELLGEALNFIFHNITTKQLPEGIYPAFSDLNSECNLLTPDDYKLISIYIQILINLGKYKESILREISTHNIIPRLLFLIEKIPVNLSDKNYRPITYPLRDYATILLNMLFKQQAIADKVCNHLAMFKWISRIIKNTIANSRELLLAETLSLLSFSPNFTPEIDYEFIIRDWVYGNLCMILMPDQRTDQWKTLNNGRTDEELLKLAIFLVIILVNTSKTQGGIDEIIASIHYYNYDIFWRFIHFLLRLKKIDTKLWVKTLNLVNNMLRHPDYNPPLYATQLSTIAFCILGNLDEILLILCCRTFKYLVFTLEEKELLLAVACQRMKQPRHSLQAPPLPNYSTLDDLNTLQRDTEKLAKEWNNYYKQKNQPWESLRPLTSTPLEFSSRQERIIHKITQEFKQYRLFFRKLPSPCTYCKDLYGPPFYPEDTFWGYYSDPEDQKIHVSTTLLQFISDITENENMKFIFDNIMCVLNEVLCIGDSDIENKAKCGIITYYLTCTELKKNFVHSYLASGMLYFHEYYMRLVLKSFSGSSISGVKCRWDPQDKFFILETDPMFGVSSRMSNWNLHILHHLLELLTTVLRQSPESADVFLRKQCSGFISINYELVLSLYKLANDNSPLQSLALDIIAKTEEVLYVFIRRFPSLFYTVLDSVILNEQLFTVYSTMTKDIPSLLSAYAHISTFYLFITKDSTNKLARKLIGTTILPFATSLVKVLRHLCTNIEQLEAINPYELRVDLAIANILERIVIVKSAHYLVLSLVHCFRTDPQCIESISPSFYVNMFSRLTTILEFADKNFKNKSAYEDNYAFPEEFKNNDIKLIPGSRNWIAVDFEYEDEDILFQMYYSSIMTWAWHISMFDQNCQGLIVHDSMKFMMRLAFEYERWEMDAFMVTTGVIYNFSVLHPNSMLNCLPVIVDIIIKFISLMKIPLESYFLLFQVLRSIHPKLSYSPLAQKLQIIIAPLRAILSSDLPMLKYYNYPMLEEVIPLEKGQIAVGRQRQERITEDETDMRTYFPLQFLRDLPEELSSTSYEIYPGQAIFQREAKTIIQLITPISNHELMKGIKKLHPVHAEGDKYVSYKDKNRDILFGAGKQVVATKTTILENHFESRVDEIYKKFLIDKFDKEHQL